MIGGEQEGEKGGLKKETDDDIGTKRRRRIINSNTYTNMNKIGLYI